MPPATTGGFANHIAPGIREIVGTNLGGRESYYSRLNNVETTNRNYEDFLAGVGIPIAVEKPQGTPIQSFDPLEGSTKRLTTKAYAIAMEVTEEAYEDDLYANKGSAIRDGANGLADSFAERVEIEGHKPFTAQGFDGTLTVLPDSSNFFSTTHAPVTGGSGPTQANTPTTDVDLSVTSYRAGLIQFRKYKNDQGLRVPAVATPRRLIVASDGAYDAAEILRSPERPDTMNRVVNVTQNETELIVDPYLNDDADAWFLQAAKHFVMLLWRKRPVIDAFDDRRSRVAINTIFGRFSAGPIHWLGCYGTRGA